MERGERRNAAVGRILEIWRYPVKSMLGERLESADIGERGLVGDRAYALVDVETGKVASAKNPRRWPNLFQFRASYLEEPRIDAQLTAARITLPDGGALSTDAPDAESRLSSALGRPVRLAQSSDAKPAELGEGYWPDYEWLAKPDTTFDVNLAPRTFFDGAMLHLITTASLKRLQSIAPSSRFDARRYRANLVIETTPDSEGFVEDGWVGKTLAIGEVVLKVDRPCPRCVMTTLPQDDLPKDPAVLRTVVQNNAGDLGVYVTVIQGGQVLLGQRLTLMDDASSS